MDLSIFGSGPCSPGSAGSNSDSNGPASAAPSTRQKSTPSAAKSSRATGRESPVSATSPPSTLPLFPPAISSAAGSHAKTSQSARSEARELACKALALASGLTWSESLKLNAQTGSWSRTWREAGASGFPLCDGTWDDSTTRRFRSNWRRAVAACPTFVSDSSCWPTPTASAYGSGNNGCPGDGRKRYAQKGKPSLWSRARAAGGHLNPLFSLWLMGFPKDWLGQPGGQSETR